VCKKSIKIPQPFVKKNEKCQDPSRGDFLTHTVYYDPLNWSVS